MSTSLSTLVDNLSDRIHDKHKCDSCGSNFEYIRRKKSGKLLLKRFKKDLIEKFRNKKRHLSLLRKGIYPYEYMDDWDRFNE